MTSWFLGVDYPQRYVASVTDFPSSFPPKVCTSARGPTVETTAEAGTDCSSLGETCQWDSGGIWSSAAGTAEQAALSPRLQKFWVYPVECFVKSAQLHVEDRLPRSQIVLYEEAGMGRPTCDPGFAMVLVDTPENSLCVC